MKRGILFTFFDPDEEDPTSVVGRLNWPSDRVGEAAFGVAGLFTGAATFFRGLFPEECPFFPWGKAIPLPWMADYHEQSGGAITGKPIGREVSEVARLLSLETAAPWGATYQIWNQPKEVMQGLAVEVMVSADEALVHLSRGTEIEALHAMSKAHRNIIECTTHAVQILRLAGEEASSLAETGRRRNLGRARAWTRVRSGRSVEGPRRF